MWSITRVASEFPKLVSDSEQNPAKIHVFLEWSKVVLRAQNTLHAQTKWTYTQNVLE